MLRNVTRKIILLSLSHIQRVDCACEYLSRISRLYSAKNRKNEMNKNSNPFNIFLLNKTSFNTLTATILVGCAYHINHD